MLDIQSNKSDFTIQNTHTRTHLENVVTKLVPQEIEPGTYASNAKQ